MILLMLFISILFSMAPAIYSTVYRVVTWNCGQGGKECFVLIDEPALINNNNVLIIIYL